MSGISSSVGPFSGIDSGSLIEQLLAVESRPKILAQSRATQLQSQRAALLDLNSAVLALKTASGNLRTNKTFRASRATSSDESILTATASAGAAAGAYRLTVSRLVSTQQQISRGFTDRDTTAVGLTSATIEVGGGRLDSETSLGSLNGGAGVARGKIRITDRLGAIAVVDLSTAATVNDVIAAINANGVASVTASVGDDGLVITDTSGGSGTFKIDNVAGYTTATSLGIAQSVGAATITGSAINTIGGATALSTLNDGAGVTIRSGLAVGSADFIITARNGQQIKVELGRRETTTGSPPNVQVTVTQTEATTLQDVITRINQATGNNGRVVASLDTTGRRIVLNDTTLAPDITGNLIVTEANPTDPLRTTARDLGLSGIDVASSSASGRRLTAALNSTLASNVNGATGVGGSGAAQFEVTRRDGTSFLVNVNADDSISTIVRAINTAGGGTVTAALNRAGNGLTITDTTTGASTAIQDVIGGVAAGLGIDDDDEEDGVIESGNLQARWINGATRLSSLNSGAGVGTGTIRVIDSTGATSNIIIGESVKTVDDFLKQVNNNGTRVRARINARGDGVEFYDPNTAGVGAVAIKVEDASGTVARRLNVLGTSESGVAGQNFIDGSFEREVEFEATDTLDDVLEKINALGSGVSASIITDGGSGSPHRLVLTARNPGATGRAIVDFGAADLGFTTLTEGRNALAFFGSVDPAQGILLSSATNSLDSAIGGVTIDLKKASTTSVEVVVSRDTSAIETGIESLVSSFNTILDKIKKYDTYDPEAKRAGVLLGDISVSTVRSGLYRIAQGTAFDVSGRYQRLTDVGVKVGSGGKLEFDKNRFRDAYTSDPQAVEDLFTAFAQETPSNAVGPDGQPLPGNVPGQTPTVTTSSPTGPPVYTSLGFGELFKNLGETLTNAVDGVLTRRDEAIESQIEVQNRRIQAFDVTLERKRQRLQRQFLAMEQAIASLQVQQRALGSLGA